MTKKKAKHNYRNSTYEEKPMGQYFTAPWVTKVMMQRLLLDLESYDRVLEPFAGRGDMAKVLMNGFKVDCFDIDDTNYLLKSPKLKVQNFLDLKPSPKLSDRYQAIVTNPPYGGDNVEYAGRKMPRAEAMVRHALSLDIPYVAMLLRADFNHASGRTDLFTNPGYGYAYEVALTSRPRWDWWIPYSEVPKDKRKTPMHNYSWFVWDKNYMGKVATTYYASAKEFLDASDRPATNEYDI